MKPPLVVGTPDGKELGDIEEFSGKKMRDLLLLRNRPKEGPKDSMIEKAAERLFGGPHKVPSSRYHTLRSKSGTVAWIFSTSGWRERAKHSGQLRFCNASSIP